MLKKQSVDKSIHCCKTDSCREQHKTVESFSDEQVQDLKNYIEKTRNELAVFAGLPFNVLALLARLEAAEDALKYMAVSHQEDFKPAFEAMQRWRTAAGKEGR